MYLHTSAYSLHKNVHFSVYGENVVIGLQNLIIIGLYWNYNKLITMKEKVWCCVFFFFYVMLLLTDRVLSESAWKMVLSSNIFISN
jgi:hypothetical protein